jgi:hypothetical protein
MVCSQESARCVDYQGMEIAFLIQVAKVGLMGPTLLKIQAL